MAKQKLRFYEIANTSDLLITPWEDFSLPYKWKRKETFGYKKIVLELACGKGQYSVGLAPHFPDTLFIGIDIKWDRISRGIQQANEQGLHNVRFIRGIIHHLDHRFAEGEVDEIWIVHPDPRPRVSDEKRRLTSPRFLSMYKKLLREHWRVRVKTDDKDLFQYSLEQFQLAGWKCLGETKDLYASSYLSDHYGIVTDYEKLALHAWKTICYGIWED